MVYYGGLAIIAETDRPRHAFRSLLAEGEVNHTCAVRARQFSTTSLAGESLAAMVLLLWLRTY